MKIEVKEKYKQYLSTREGADIYNRFKEILYGNPDNLVLTLSNRLSARITKKKINILDIGGGDGKRLLLLMDTLNAKGVECSATLVDQSKIFIEDLETSDNFTANIYPVHSTFEAFESLETYDVILLIHSIFTFKDASYVDRLKKLLNSQGVIIAISDSPDSLLAGLKAITDGSFGTERKGIESFIKDLKRGSFTTEQETVLTCYNDCISNGKLDNNGRLILGWIALRDWKEIPPAMVDMATKLFIERSKNRKICDTEYFVYANL